MKRFDINHDSDRPVRIQDDIDNRADGRKVHVEQVIAVAIMVKTIDRQGIYQVEAGMDAITYRINERIYGQDFLGNGSPVLSYCHWPTANQLRCTRRGILIDCPDKFVDVKQHPWDFL